MSKPDSKSSKASSRAGDEPEQPSRISNGANVYQIGAEIGRGAFAVVFAALNVSTGVIVAVKRFPVTAIDSESLSSIEAEIELMQKLNHPHIVKYIDTIRAKDYLHIVLEYMENGSLAHVIKKFKPFPESLTAIYVAQVLSGLKYLHEQGVLHRDIKGANILTTKDGMVKLADFGVAMKLNDPSNAADQNNVVGSPYWIAPEIIEMSAPTSACDIWSVGCIIIELLTGKPPYYDLEPMAALFRIVQDDYPPLPEGISQALRDFLLLCFQKEPVMRASAGKLLEHPWLHNALTSAQAPRVLGLPKVVVVESSASNSGGGGSNMPKLSKEVSINKVPTVVMNEDDDNNSSSSIGRLSIKSMEQHNNAIAAASGNKGTKEFKEGGTPRSRINNINNSNNKPQHVNTTRSSSNSGKQNKNINNSSSRTLDRNNSSSNNLISTNSSYDESNKSSEYAAPSIDIEGGVGGDSRPSSRLSNSTDETNEAVHSSAPNSSSKIRHGNNNNHNRYARHSRNQEAIQNLTMSSTDFTEIKQQHLSRSNNDIFAGMQKLETSDSEIENDFESAANLLDTSNVSNNNNTNNSNIIINDEGFSSGLQQQQQQLYIPSLAKSHSSARSRGSINNNNAVTGSGNKSITSEEKEENSSDNNWDGVPLTEELSASLDSLELPLVPPLNKAINSINFRDVAFDSPLKNSKLKSFSLDPYMGRTKLVRRTVMAHNQLNNPNNANNNMNNQQTTPSPPLFNKFSGNSSTSLTQQQLFKNKLSGNTNNASFILNQQHQGAFMLAKFQEQDEDGFDDMIENSPRQGGDMDSSFHPPTNIDSSSSSSMYIHNNRSGLNINSSLSHITMSAPNTTSSPHTNSSHNMKLFNFTNIPPISNNNTNNLMLKPGSNNNLSNKSNNSITLANNSSNNNDDNEVTDDDFNQSFELSSENLKSKLCAIANKNQQAPGSADSNIDKRTTAAIMGALNTFSSSQDDSFEDFDDGSSHNNSELKDLAGTLRKRMQKATNDVVQEGGFDDFLKYQFDEKDFKQNENKDIHFRRSREVVGLMARIKPETKEKEVIELCDKLMQIFEEFPEQRDHLTTYHGVMPIIDMFEARSSAGTLPSKAINSIPSGRTKILRPYVLRVINKIIEGSTKAQEQLSLVGIIPTIMNIFERSYRPFHPSPHYISSAITPYSILGSSSGSSNNNKGGHGGNSSPSALIGGYYSRGNSLEGEQLNNNTNANAGSGTNISANNNNNSGISGTENTVDPVTLEAARFIHQISSTSSLTLQMLIGAGGLSVITSMVSFGSRIVPKGPITPALKTETSTTLANTSTDSLNNLSNSTIPTTTITGIGINNSNTMSSLFDNLRSASSNNPSIDQVESSDKSTAKTPTINLLLPPAIFIPKSTDSDSTSSMAIFQMGIDCITHVFSVQSSRTRDFCRLFVKLGLLPHLAVGFQNILSLYVTQVQNKDSTEPSTARTESGRQTTTNNPHRRNQSNQSTHSITDSMGSNIMVSAIDETPERKYTFMIATLFSRFSRSDPIVAEQMVHNDYGVITVILTALRAPELRQHSNSNSISLQADGKNNSTSNAGLLSLPSSGNTSTIVPTLTLNNITTTLNSSTTIGGLSSPGTSTTNFTPFDHQQRRKQQYLLNPTYVEIIELLLKCLKNLSMEPSALNDMEKAGTIETLIPLLSGPISEKCRNHVIPCIFNLCRINKRRQELACALGIVPHLKRMVTDKSHLKQFALPILFDLAHTSAVTRTELWKNDCVAFYLDMLKESYWQSFALNSLATWLSNDSTNVSRLLVEPSRLSRLIDFFRNASTQTVHSLHKPLYDMMFKSKELSRALACSGLFVSALVRRLTSTTEAIVLRSLLKMLSLMHQYHPFPRQLVIDNNLYTLVRDFAQSEGQVLVCQIANKLLRDFQMSTLT